MRQRHFPLEGILFLFLNTEEICYSPKSKKFLLARNDLSDLSIFYTFIEHADENWCLYD
jgi:hypothetical protein